MLDIRPNHIMPYSYTAGRNVPITYQFGRGGQSLYH